MMVVPGGVGKSKNLVPLHSYSTYLPPRLSLVRVGTLNEDARANKGNGGGNDNNDKNHSKTSICTPELYTSNYLDLYNTAV
jgi:hypothetical protein